MTPQEAEALAVWLRSQRPDVIATASYKFVYRDGGYVKTDVLHARLSGLDHDGKPRDCHFRIIDSREAAETWLAGLPPPAYQTDLFSLFNDDDGRK